MTHKSYVLRKAALSDLDNIWEYTLQEWSVEQADTYYNELIRAFIFLANNRDVGKSVPIIRNGYKVWPVNSHLIFYKNIKVGVEIIRVLHQKSDVEKWF